MYKSTWNFRKIILDANPISIPTSITARTNIGDTELFTWRSTYAR